MELSVRGPFAPRQTGPAVPREGGAALSAARAMPLLRVWETKRLLLHEEADAARVRRLADALRRDGVLRNPPIVAALPDGRAIVLDGANRVTALCTLRVPHAVVQSVSYDNPNVRLSLWRHYVPEAVPGALRAAAEALGSTAPVSDEADAESQIAAGDGIAAIIDARGGVVLRGAGRPAAGHHEIKAGGAVAAAAALGRFVAVYRDGRAVHRVDAGTLEELRAAYGDGALVLFRRFEKLDILNLAVEGGRLPAGITRHVIPGRALRLNTPLAWLADGIDLAVKQAALEAQLQQRWQAYGVRYYAEPTFLFDE